MDERGFDRLLDLVYGTILEPGLWVTALEGIVDAMGGSNAWLSKVSTVDGEASGILARIDPASVPRYEYYRPLNVFAIKPNPAQFARQWSPVIKTPRDFDIENITGTEYFNDFMLPNEAADSIFINLAVEGMDMVDVNISRPPWKDPFGPAELELAARLQPHLIRAYTLGRVFDGGGALGEAATTILDQSTHGIFILDAAGRVRHVNAAGERVLARGRGLSVVGGRLAGASATVTEALYALVGKASSRDPAIRAGGSMALPRAPGKAPLSLSAAPFRTERSPVVNGEASVIVCVTDLEADIELSERRMRELFALTSAEVRVAHMMLKGATPREAAEQSGVSLTTVRSQLASIFGKTGAAGQAELSRVLMRMTTGFAD